MSTMPCLGNPPKWREDVFRFDEYGLHPDVTDLPCETCQWHHHESGGPHICQRLISPLIYKNGQEWIE